MSNYVQSTNFATKDALPSGDPLKIVKGTEINTEFANIAIAVATKADLVSPTFTGTPAAPTASAGTNSTQLATTAYADAAVAAAKLALYPVGSIYINATNANNPSTYLGFGTWVAFGEGLVMIGTGAGFTAGATGGSADAIVVSHTHTATTTITDSGHTHQFTHGLEDTGGGGQGFTWYNIGGEGGNVTETTTSSTTGITAATTVASSGSSGTNANYQPYITVYMWKRTA